MLQMIPSYESMNPQAEERSSSLFMLLKAASSASFGISRFPWILLAQSWNKVKKRLLYSFIVRVNEHT